MAVKLSISDAKKLGVSTIRDYKGKQQVTNIVNGKIIKANRHKMTSLVKNNKVTK